MTKQLFVQKKNLIEKKNVDDVMFSTLKKQKVVKYKRKKVKSKKLNQNT